MERVPFLLVVLVASTYAKNPDSLSTSTIPDSLRSSQRPFSLLYDPGMTERAGIEDVLTMHYGITQAEDAIVGVRWFSEKTLLEKSGGILARSIKYLLLDYPFDYFVAVFVHEYFGHGMRWREFTNNEIQYHIGAPPPYGKGDGYAQAMNSTPLSFHEILALGEGGIESQALLNRAIAMRWMATNEIGYRDAALYFVSFSNSYSYIKNAPENLPFNHTSGDPLAYVQMLNLQAGSTNWNNAKMSVGAFKSQMKLNLMNPFFFYSLYLLGKDYLLDGNSSSEFPTLHIADVRYLPVFRVGMTPFGTENHLEHYLRFRETTFLIDLRLGDQTFYSSWGGIGLSCRDIASWSRWSADMNIDIWKQPELMIHGDQVIWNRSGTTLVGPPGRLEGGGFGGAISVRGRYRFTGSHSSLVATVELGYKSVGFLEGYSLDASPILMIGIGLLPI